MATTEAEVIEPETGDELEPEIDPETELPPEPGPDDEPEPEPQEEPAALSEAEIEKAMKSLDKEATRHANRISEIIGADAQALSPCPLCVPNMSGFVFADAIPDDTRAAVLAFLNPEDMPDMQQEPGIEMCDLCFGWGETLTGSKIPGKEKKLCGKCSGNGFTDPQARASWTMMHPPEQPVVVPYVAPIATTTPANGMPATDMLGRPFGNQFYGRDPQYMTADERANDPWAPK